MALPRFLSSYCSSLLCCFSLFTASVSLWLRFHVTTPGFWLPFPLFCPVHLRQTLAVEFPFPAFWFLLRLPSAYTGGVFCLSVFYLPMVCHQQFSRGLFALGLLSCASSSIFASFFLIRLLRLEFRFPYSLCILPPFWRSSIACCACWICFFLSFVFFLFSFSSGVPASICQRFPAFPSFFSGRYIVTCGPPFSSLLSARSLWLAALNVFLAVRLLGSNLSR